MPTYTEQLEAVHDTQNKMLAELEEFRKQYHKDMHGDSKLNGGDPKIVGAMRGFKTWQGGMEKRVTDLEEEDSNWKTIAGITAIISAIIGGATGLIFGA